MGKMQSKKAQDNIDSFLISLIIGLLVVVGLNVSVVIVKDNAASFRQTPEYYCLEKIAMKFCEERGMEFQKVYSPIYRTIWITEDFACYERCCDVKHFAFTREEEYDCKYGRRR